MQVIHAMGVSAMTDPEGAAEDMTRMVVSHESLRSRLAEVERERDAWKEDARLYCLNADHHREQVVALRAMMLEVADWLEDRASHGNVLPANGTPEWMADRCRAALATSPQGQDEIGVRDGE